jgi:glycosyltransferase involved in cell wall biosynthesis
MPAQIRAIFEEIHRPLWSVMIPIYNRTTHLEQALRSVLAAGYNENKMQIEVVDDCSTKGISESIVESISPNRISFYRQPHRLGLARNWNTCIERAQGRLVHILHDDDFVADGYYREIEALAEKYPDVGLYSTRCFFIDNDSIIVGVTNRVLELERPGKSIAAFLYQTPIECASVTVRRTAYEALGGFRLDLGYATDCEMWARVTGELGAVVSTNIMAFRRMSEETETTRVKKTAQAIADIHHLNAIFSRRYREFSVDTGRARVSNMAWEHYRRYRLLGDNTAADANWRMWVQLTPVQHRLARRFSSRIMPFIRKLVIGARL